MERISREEMLMEVAHVVARRGTCSRAQVGVVFAREGRILATGYNGAPPGVPHCIHESFYLEPTGGNIPPWLLKIARNWEASESTAGDFTFEGNTSYHWDGKTLTRQFGKADAPGCTVVSHAERNGIAFAAREGIRLGDSDVYCTHAPCEDCAKSLLASGIRSLTFRTPYRLTAGVDLLRNAGIALHHPN